MTVAVLAVQGAFAEHIKVLTELGVNCIELRKMTDLEQSFDALVLPGGESTVQGKLLKEFEMFDELKKRIEEGMPVLATCAGLILLAESIENDERNYFQTLPVKVIRNAYGRQLSSFYVEENLRGCGKVPMTFIRAPYIKEAYNDVEVLAKVDEKIVAVCYKNQIALAFHPELNEDKKIYHKFINMVKENN